MRRCGATLWSRSVSPPIRERICNGFTVFNELICMEDGCEVTVYADERFSAFICTLTANVT